MGSSAAGPLGVCQKTWLLRLCLTLQAPRKMMQHGGSFISLFFLGTYAVLHVLGGSKDTLPMSLNQNSKNDEHGSLISQRFSDFS